MATLAPVVMLVLIAAVTAGLVFLAWGLNQPTDGHVVRAPIWAILLAYTVGCLGPVGTGILGGLCMLATVAWLVVRVIDPPIDLTLKPRAKKDRDEGDD